MCRHKSVVVPVHAPVSALAHRGALGVDAQLRQLQKPAAGKRPAPPSLVRSLLLPASLPAYLMYALLPTLLRLP